MTENNFPGIPRIGVLGRDSSWDNIENLVKERGHETYRAHSAQEALDHFPNLTLDGFMGDMVSYFDGYPNSPDKPLDPELKRLYQNKDQIPDGVRECMITAFILKELFGANGQFAGKPVILATNYPIIKPIRMANDIFYPLRNHEVHIAYVGGLTTPDECMRLSNQAKMTFYRA